MRQILAGTIDVSVVVRIIDSVDGTPETAVVAAGVSLEYRRELAASVGLTESNLAALTTAHTDGGMLHIGNGYYRVDLPDLACAVGAVGVLVHGTGTGLIVIGEYIELVAYNPYDAVRMGLTALPNAAAEAAGGLYTRGTGAGQINQPANGMIDGNIVRWLNTAVATPATAGIPRVAIEAAADFAQTAADKIWASTTRTLTAFSTALALSVWDVLEAAIVTASSIGLKVKTNLDATVSSRSTYAGADTSGTTTLLSRIIGTLAAGTHQPQSGDSFTRLGAPVGASHSADVANVQADTDNLQTRLPAALVGGRMDASVGAMATDVITAAAIATDAIGSAELAATAITEIQTGLATSAALTTAQADLDDLQTRLPAALVGGRIDASVGAMAANVVNANALATDAVTEIQTGLSTVTVAQVKTQVVDALNVDTYPEPGQGAPPATTTIVQRLSYLYKAWRNRTTATSSQYSLYNDAAVVVDQKAPLSDSAGTTERAEILSGP